MRTFSLASYTNGAYTDLVKSGGLPNGTRVTNLTISNSSTAANALARVVDKDGNVRAVILPTTSIEANGAYILDLKGLGLVSGDRLQVQGSAAGLNFYATADE